MSRDEALGELKAATDAVASSLERQVRAIRQADALGVPVTEIAKITGRSRQWVYNHLAR
ncbi:helix-turn-helix domain-containing protein [Corynebacterium otitidis]